MSVQPQLAQYCADLVITSVVSQYAREKELSTTEALRIIMKTKTFNLLQDSESRLCFESAESILHILNAEECGDWEEWFKE